MILHVIINTMTSIILPALLILVEGSLSGISPSQVQLVSVITHPGVLALLLYVAGLFVHGVFLLGNHFVFGDYDHCTAVIIWVNLAACICSACRQIFTDEEKQNEQ